MFGFALKSTMFYMFWKKFKTQIITALVSITFILFLNAIYEDINNIFLQKELDYLFELVAVKFGLILFLFIFNVFNFIRVIKKEHKNTEVIEEAYTPRQIEILNKKKLKTKTDVILQKYLDK